MPKDMRQAAQDYARSQMGIRPEAVPLTGQDMIDFFKLRHVIQPGTALFRDHWEILRACYKNGLDGIGDDALLHIALTVYREDLHDTDYPISETLREKFKSLDDPSKLSKNDAFVILGLLHRKYAGKMAAIVEPPAAPGLSVEALMPQEAKIGGFLQPDTAELEDGPPGGFPPPGEVTMYTGPPGAEATPSPPPPPVPASSSGPTTPKNEVVEEPDNENELDPEQEDAFPEYDEDTNKLFSPSKPDPKAKPGTKGKAKPLK